MAGETIALDAGESSHLSRVRRASLGDDVELINGQGILAQGVIANLAKSKTLVEVRTVALEEVPPIPFEIAPSLTRNSAFDEIIERGIEMGVTGFHPVESEFSVARLDERKSANKLERWNRLARESLKQCERLWAPSISPQNPISDVLSLISSRGIEPLVLMERANDWNGPIVTPSALPCGPICVFTGPEGGWSQSEKELFQGQGVRVMSLGPGILRAETASLAAIAILSYQRHLNPIAPMMNKENWEG